MERLIPHISGTAERKEGSFRLGGQFSVSFGGFEEWCMEAFCERGGFSYTVSSDVSDVKLVKEEAMAAEEYAVGIDGQGITVSAADERGIVWAFATLTELMDETHTLPCGTFADKPRFRHRGLLLDCVRHFFGIEEVKRVIDEISRVKMNVLHWHLADDQGFRIESAKYPKLHETSGDFYTQQEIREIVAYAKRRGVEIIPEIDMPGHTSGILAAYPEYSCSGKAVSLATGGGIFPVVLCPGNEEVYRFLEELLGEIVPLFASEWFHIGGDETPDVEWKKCSRCQGLMERNHYTSTRQLQGHFSGRVKEILKRLGKKVICWNDSLEADNLARDKDLMVQFWSVQYADATQKYIKEGGQFIYSDMFELYIDYPCAMSSAKKVYRTLPMIRREDYSNEGGLAGMECCLWTENIREGSVLEERLFPRIYAFAENTWYGNPDYEAFKGRMAERIRRVKERGIHCLTLEEADPQGEARKQGIREYTAIMQCGMSEEARKTAIEYTKPGKEFEERFMEKFFGEP